MDQTIHGLNTRALLTAALIAGAGIGLLSNIPLLACVNCLFMAWVWGGGIGAVYLYRRNTNQLFLSITQGMLLGAAAGVVGGIVGAVMSLLLSGVSAAFADVINSMSQETARAIPSFLLSSGFTFIGALGSVFVYAIVAGIGGLIATALIWKTPVAPIAPPPPYTPPTQGPTI